MAFALIGLSIGLSGLNMIATIMTKRAPGMPLTKMPVFVWSVLVTSFLGLLAAPALIGAILLETIDRSYQTTFFVPAGGGSPFLWENLFWFFGHPEVYIFIIPAFGLVMEMLPVFTRRPLWGYRVGIGGMLGVGLLSFTVWQHHLFVSGLAPSLRPFYMFSTELISVPTGIIYLVALGAMWRARIRFGTPMLFICAFFFNFLIGGFTGVFLSDVPSDFTLHASYFVQAHFHYTIMGGEVFALMAGHRLLPAEDDRAHHGHEAAAIPVLGGVHHIQRHLHLTDRGRHHGDDAPRDQLRGLPAAPQRLRFAVRLRPRRLDGVVPRDPHLGCGEAGEGRAEPMGVAGGRMAACHSGPCIQLRQGADIMVAAL